MKRRISIMLTVVMVMSMIFTTGVFAASTYTVETGDVLWKIAREYDLDWKDLAEFNKMDNPHLIYTGDKIMIPTAAELAAMGTGESEETTITVLATADLHGRIYPYEYAIDSEDSDAGIAKIQTLVKAERAASDNVILMDVGDTVQDNSAELFNNQDVHPMVEALNYMNYDVWTVGNHEFNFEKEFLEKNVEAFEGAVLAANVRQTSDGDYWLDPYTIIEKDGVRVAIVGLLPPHIDVWEASSPSHYEGLEFTDTVEEAKIAIAALEGKYDVLVGAFHLGKDGEHEYQGAAAVAEACPEFDVMFLGHAHDYFDDVVVNGVQLIEPGKYGANLAKAEIVVASGVVTSVTTSNIYTGSVEPDADLLEKFAYVHEESLADANTVIGTVTADYVERVDYITGEASVTTMPTAQIMDTALIDLINDVQMFYTGADVSSAAAFKSDMNLLAGDFMKKNAADIYKYTNTLMGVNITGANLKEYMEWSASYYNTFVPGDVTVSFDQNVRSYNYDMFSGVTYDIDISQPAGDRIVNLLLGGEAVDDEAVYKLAVNNYRFGTLLGLGLVTDEDTYYDSYEELQDAGRIRDMIGVYITEEKDGMATPSVDNNWKIIGNEETHVLADEALQLVIDGIVEIPVSEDGRTPNVKSVNVYDLIKEGYFPDYKSITILHTNDMHGFFVEGTYDGMGAAKMKTIFDMYTDANPNTLILDAGDATQGANLVTLSNGVNAIEIMNLLGYDAMAAGNHEFDYTKQQVLDNAALADFPMMAANIKNEDGTTFLDAYVIKEIDGVKVAIFGLTTPDTKFLSHPDNSLGLTFEDPSVTAAELVPMLREEADVVIALVHLGDIASDYTSVDLANNVEGIDLIIDGHAHNAFDYGKVVNGTLLVAAGEKTKNVGVVELAIMDGDVVSADAHLYGKALTTDTAEDAEVLALVEEIKAENVVIEEEVVATTAVELDGVRENVRTTETNLGNLIAESLLEASGADLALTNGGGIRASINVGDITKGEVLTVLPYGNLVRIIELTGADVIAALENGLKSYPEALGAYPQIAGMTVEFDASKEAGSRVVSVMVGDVAIDEDATYTLATNDYLVAGGDGYASFVGKTVVAELGTMDQVLIDYINEFGTDAGEITNRIKNVAEIAALIFDYLFAA